jgi:hypothetical protein
VIDGIGYIAYSLIDCTTVGASIWPPFLQSIYVRQLSPNMKNTTWSVGHVVSAANDLVDMEAESPDVFKRGEFSISLPQTPAVSAQVLSSYYTTLPASPVHGPVKLSAVILVKARPLACLLCPTQQEDQHHICMLRISSAAHHN